MRTLAIALVALTSPVAAVGATNDATAAKFGANWLKTQSISSGGQQADAIVAMRAAGVSQTTLRVRLSRLATIAPAYGAGAGSAGKVVLAAVAAGVNPRNVGGVNYVARIKATYRNGRYGSGTYDQAYAILGLRAAGEGVPIMALRAVTGARGTGGWGFALTTSGRDDVSATGLMVEALRAAGLSVRHGGLRSATTWMIARRNAAGGYAIDGGNRPTEANSTAIAIRAMRAMGIAPPARTIRQLRLLQEADGGVRFTAAARGSRVMATVDAVVALAGRRLPVR